MAGRAKHSVAEGGNSANDYSMRSVSWLVGRIRSGMTVDRQVDHCGRVNEPVDLDRAPAHQLKPGQSVRSM